MRTNHAHLATLALLAIAGCAADRQAATHAGGHTEAHEHAAEAPPTPRAAPLAAGPVATVWVKGIGCPF